MIGIFLRLVCVLRLLNVRCLSNENMVVVNGMLGKGVVSRG